MTRILGTPRPVAVLVATVVALLLAVVSIAGAPPAAAHNTLTGSDPVANGVVSALPQSFSLTFNDQVKSEFVTVVLTPDGGAPTTLTPTVSGPTVNATLPAAVPSPGPDPGAGRAYRLGYRVISADDHPISGSIDFTVGTTALPFGGGASGGSSAAADASAVDAQVAPAPSGTDRGAPLGWWVVAGVVVLAVAAAVFWLRSRRREPSDRNGSGVATPSR